MCANVCLCPNATELRKGYIGIGYRFIAKQILQWKICCSNLKNKMRRQLKLE